ncbi:MAG TPA: helix-turn-helix transcriptional regulator, partial [Blastocatellia bacterium]|nr:helix-turn-helix transcriptional regulator [Blastocatellia bacterium]
VESAQSATPQPTGDPDEGVAGSANVGAATSAQEATEREFAPRPDVSDQGWQELVPKLLGLFNNNREQLGRALGLHRSTVDRWLNGKSKPNTSTILRMRRLAQERQVE